MSGSLEKKGVWVMVKGVRRTSIYDEIGWRGLLNVVWNSTPRYIKLLAFPYGLCVYRHALKASSTLQQLLGLHTREYMSSKVFRLLRPRFHIVKDVLQNYGIGV
jgi:hypothetical protein